VALAWSGGGGLQRQKETLFHLILFDPQVCFSLDRALEGTVSLSSLVAKTRSLLGRHRTAAPLSCSSPRSRPPRCTQKQ